MTLLKNSLIVPKIKIDLDILMINPYTKFHFSTRNLCLENERELLVDLPTDRRTEAKHYALPSSKGGRA